QHSRDKSSRCATGTCSCGNLFSSLTVAPSFRCHRKRGFYISSQNLIHWVSTAPKRNAGSNSDRIGETMRRCVIIGICVPFMLAGEAKAYKAYVSNEKSNTISIIDTSERKVVGTIKVGQRPRGIAITKDQKYVLVAVGDDDTIQMIDTASNKVVDT